MTTGPFKTGEQVDLSMLQPAIDLLERTWAACEATNRNPPQHDLTARKIDESQTAGSRVYIGASGQMSVTRDNLSALWALINAHGVQPWATWSLLRPAFETAFNTVWILEPETGIKRRQRALRLEVLNYREANAVLREHEKNPLVGEEAKKRLHEREQTIEKTFRREATELGMTWDFARSSINKVDELAKLGFTLRLQPELRSMMPAIWRILSGAEHGYSHALLSTSDVVKGPKIPGGQQIQVVVNDESLQSQATLVLLLAIEGAELYRRRSTRTG